MKYKANLRYKILSNHPDKDSVIGGWNPDRVYECDDIYDFDPDIWIEATRKEKRDYILNDLAKIAGGGYRTDTIEIVEFNVELE